MEIDLVEKEISSQKQAHQMVFCDLINAMLQENLSGFLDRAQLGTEWIGSPGSEEYSLDQGERYFYWTVDQERTLMFRVCRGRFIQPYKISRLPVVLLSKQDSSLKAQELDPIVFMQVFADSLPVEERSASLPNLPDFLNELRDSIRHASLSLQAMSWQDGRHGETNASLLQWERFSALRDRPFHPTSRAKRGWNDDDYKRYSPEFGRAFGLDWVAVHRDFIQSSTAEEIAAFILNESERETLRLAAKQAGIEEGMYVLVPVHPWQMEHILPSHYQKELAQGICVPVARGLGQFRATSSVRSLMAPGIGNSHVKVPIGIYSLGALRLLPPRYLHNGAKGQALLQQVAQKDSFLQKRLRLCDETNWWGFYEPKGDPFKDKPGHLACLIREYPSDLLEDHDVDLIPMSALAVIDADRGNPVVSRWLAKRFGTQAGKAEALALFKEIAGALIETSLRCFRYGVMPEIHGQNVVLIVTNHRISGLLLRDHDTIRLHIPWLTREGLSDPGYIVKPGTPNSLLNETPAQLLSYFQTLGVQVNLYAIADALSKAYSIKETLFWREIEGVVRDCLAQIDFPASVRVVLEQQLLASETWPTRLLLTPLLKRTGSGGGSMPAGSGVTDNPLWNLP
jgi:siderophore synthetase component